MAYSMSDFRFIDDAVSSAIHPLVGPLMTFANNYWWPLWCVLFFFGFLLTLAPWQLPTEHNSLQSIAHFIRRSIFYISFISIALLSFIYLLFDITFSKVIPDSNLFFLNWFLKSLNVFKWYVLFSAISGLFLRFYYFRFFHPWVSSTLRDFRNKQSDESESDIRNERLKYNPKSFIPYKFYDKSFKNIFLGLDSNNNPVYVPASTWLETNMMVTGPTRYGKGVVIGCLMDQAIIRGDQLIYIDPKNDKFAAKIMLQTCAKSNRPFYYVSLNDEAVGYWSPFEGGKRRDAYNRLISIFGMMENSGDADFYKAMEKKVFNRLIKLDDPFDIESIYRKVKFHNENVQDDADRLLKIEAQLENWRQIESLNPPKNFTGFSLEKAMLENAVVYFQGSLNDEVAKTATKSFILEVIQESARLDLKRKSHLTFIIDEVRFLVSKTLADALATIVGFRVNIVTACQSINDLKTPDDINLDGEATYRSISTNSQLKLVYGGADSDTAEWVAKLSGTIVKQVTSMEKVTVKSAGAEEWDLGRTIKPLEEALITENVALTLPPRVCVVFRPFELATVTFTAPVPVEDMASLDKWLAIQSKNEKSSIDTIKLDSTNKSQEKLNKLEADIESLSNLPSVTNEPTSIDVSEYEAVEDPMFDAESIALNEPTSIDASDYESVEDPMFDTESIALNEPTSIDASDYEAVEDSKVNFPSPSFTFINTKNSNQFDFNYRSTPSFQSRTYDLYELSQKSDLSYDELRYIFAFSERQEKFRDLVDSDYFSALLKKKTLAKKANLIERKVVPPKYNITEIANKTIHTKDEIDWVLKTEERKEALRSLSPELLTFFEDQKKAVPPRYNITEIANKTTHTKDEIDWVLGRGKRKIAFGLIAPELLVKFEKIKQIAEAQQVIETPVENLRPKPKYIASKLAKQTSHTQDEIDWVLSDDRRRNILKSLNPKLFDTFQKSTTS